MPTDAAKPDYGIDAPGVVRNLFLVTAIGLLLFGTAAAGWWSGNIDTAVGGVRLHMPLARMALWPAVACGIMGCWMLWESKVGKVRSREKLLDQLTWTGAERVLDVGCGRGLMLIGAAKRLTTGKAVGVDIWQARDLSGNRPESTVENARREGVPGRIAVTTADMRALPIAGGALDVVVSCAAIHNLESSADRATAIAEVARVLRPGGRAIIDDIRHPGDYERTLRAHGCTTRRIDSRALSLLLMLVTFGSLLPGTLIATKER